MSTDQVGRHRAAVAPALLVLALLTMAASGCQKEASTAVVEPIFYPPPPDAPRLQFLTSFSTVDRWLKERSSFADFVIGKPKAENQTDIKSPYGVAARDGKLYICDLGTARVHVIDVGKESYSTLKPLEQTPRPVNITIDADGTKYVCDTSTRSVAVFGADDKFIRTIGDPERCVPFDLAIWGDKLVVADVANGEVEVWSKDGALLNTISSKGTGPSQLRMPTNVAVGSSGHIFVVDTELATVKEFDAEGSFVKSFGAPGDRPGYFARPKGIAIDPAGRLYVADAQWEIVQIFAPDGQLLLFFGGAAPGPEGTGLPAGAAIDATSLDAFGEFVSADFEPEYLFLLANQFGNNKIGVYAFGHRRGEAESAPEASAP